MKKRIIGMLGMAAAAILALNMNIKKAEAEQNVVEITADSDEKLQAALSEAEENATSTNIYKITVNSGTYNSSINVSSNTDIYCKEGVIFKDCGGYAVYLEGKNSSFNGGELDESGIIISDAESVKVDGTSIKNPGYSGILVRNSKGNSSISNTTISKSDKYGILVSDGTSKIDISNNHITSAATYGVYFFGVKFEGDFKGNTIENTKGTFGVRWNSATVKGNIIKNKVLNNPDVAMWFNNSKINGNVDSNTIKKGAKTGIYFAHTTVDGDIKGNTIKNMKGNGIGVYHGSKCGVISNNTISDIGGDRAGNAGDYGIVVSALDTPGTSAKAIKNNNISNVTYCGICIYAGLSPKNKPLKNYSSVKGNIEGNKLYNCGTYVCSKDWKKEIAAGGKRGSRAGIYVDHYAQVYGDICNNSVKKSQENGIYLHLGAKVRAIYKNTVSGCKVDGIQLYDKSRTKSVYNNKVSKCGRNGIRLCNSEITTALRSNTFSDNKETAVILVTGSKVKSIQSNIIKGRKTINSHGVGVYSGCTANMVKSNKISKMDWGIYFENSNKKAVVSKNKITGCRHNVTRVGAMNIPSGSSGKSGNVKVSK